MRAPGTGWPGVIAVGTRRGSFGKDFAAVHGKGPAVVVELAGTDASGGYRPALADHDRRGDGGSGCDPPRRMAAAQG